MFGLLAQVVPTATPGTTWMVAAAVVLVGLVIYGAADLFRLSTQRIGAVASVCFHESLRRRVLWLTPLAIIGVLIIAQFQRPLDLQDAIRQSIKFCTFASGMLVTIAAIMLACTNLPREIDNRVIYSIVTKPITRLEILIGKIAGFAAVSASILIIMGVFTWGFLHVQHWRIMGEIKDRLATEKLEPAPEAALNFYANYGLLNARNYVSTFDVQAYAKYPKYTDTTRVMAGGSDQECLIPFDVPNELAQAMPQDGPGMVLTLRIPWKRGEMTAEDRKLNDEIIASLPKPPAAVSPAGPGMPAATSPAVTSAAVSISAYDSSLRDILPPGAIGDNHPTLLDSPEGTAVVVPLSSLVATQFARVGQVYLQVTGLSPATEYLMSADCATLTPLDASGKPGTVIQSHRFDGNFHTPVILRGRHSVGGQQIRGGQNSNVGVFAFRNTPIRGTSPDAIFEFRSVIEASADDLDAVQAGTFAEVQVANLRNGEISQPVRVPLESKRIVHFTLPAKDLEGGDFDLIVRAVTPKTYITLKAEELRLATATEAFGLNLFKSLLVLWLFSVLVITISIFCSTFLSWPIAIVLTLLILLGNWGVTQLGDVAGVGVGRQIVNDMFPGAAPAVAETMNRTFEGLSAMLRTVAAILPDISQFDAVQDTERGLAITFGRMLQAVKVLFLFGLPILTLSYVFFRNKEVAP